MQRIKLGDSGPEVSAVCLGTMTFGNQTDQADAFAQMDRAAAAGISFLDVAEMYPVNPVRSETSGRSEEIIGAWLAGKARDKIEIATKVTGPSQTFRGGAGFNGKIVAEAIEASLRRLRTDYIDLYQLHWPMRGSYHFRQIWSYAPPTTPKDESLAHMDEVIAALAAAQKAGKIRAFGLSNETAWGLTRWCDRGRSAGLRPVSIQNEYSLLCRSYDGDLAEATTAEGVTLLAFSPLAAGLLSGKYLGGAIPEGSRAAVDKTHGGLGQLGGRKTARAETAVAEYVALARAHGWDPIHMALAFTRSRPFATIPILGATSDAQLAHQLEGIDRELPDDLRKAIDKLHKAHPMPY